MMSQASSMQVEIDKSFHQVEKKGKQKNYAHRDMTIAFPKFDFDELIVGRTLGKSGDFLNFYEIVGFRTGKETKGDAKTFRADIESKSSIANTNNTEPYVLKTMYAVKEPQGIRHLHTEARILSNMHHPNIIKLKATSNNFESRFLVFERLFGTLNSRMTKWADKEKKIGLVFRKRQRLQLYQEKMHIAYDITSALSYLHDHGIIHRDIKPDNMAFDLDGNLKLFNFGLATEVPYFGERKQNAERHPESVYNLTIMVGTPRYMAPEVGLGKPYSISCDVYSFAMMLAQMLTSKLPYENHTTMDMVCKVWQGSERPDLRCFEFIPEPIKVILGQAWGSSIQRRPTMKEICHVLASEMNSEPPMKKTIEWLTTESSCPCCQKTEMRIEQRDEINQEPPPFFLPEHRALEV